MRTHPLSTWPIPLARPSVILFAVLLSIGLACGGSSGGSAPIPPPPPPAQPRIVYMVQVPIPGKTWTQNDLRSILADGTGDVALANGPESEYPLLDTTTGRNQVLVLGGRLVYYISPASGEQHFHSVNLDGTGTAALSDPTQYSDYRGFLGDRLIFALATTGGYSVKVDGTGRVAFPADAEIRGLALGRVFYNSALASGSKRFYSALPDGSGAVELLNAPGEVVRQFTPAGYAVPLLAGDKVLFAHIVDPTNQEIYASLPDGSAKLKLAGNVYGSGSSFSGFAGTSAMKVAGNRLAYFVWVSGTALSVRSVALDGTAPVTHGDLPTSMGAFTAAMGTQLFLEEINGLSSEVSVFRMDVSGTAAPALVARNASTGMVLGSRLTYLVGTGPMDVVSILPDGTSPITLATGIRADMTYGGDDTVANLPVPSLGSRLVFRKDATAGGTLTAADLLSVSADGTGLATLVTGGDKDMAHLGPDRLYFHRFDAASKWHLFSIRLDGTGLTALANGPTFEYFGGFLGTQVLFHRAASDGHSDLWVVNADGTSPRQITKSSYNCALLGVY